MPCHRKLVAVSNLPATRFEDMILLASQAYDCEQLANHVVWGHEYVITASVWLRATYQRRDLGTRFRYHRKFVAVSDLPATRAGDTIHDYRKLVAANILPVTKSEDTITLPSQACGCQQLTSDEICGHDYITIAGL